MHGFRTPSQFAWRFSSSPRLQVRQRCGDDKSIADAHWNIGAWCWDTERDTLVISNSTNHFFLILQRCLSGWRLARSRLIQHLTMRQHEEFRSPGFVERASPIQSGHRKLGGFANASAFLSLLVWFIGSIHRWVNIKLCWQAAREIYSKCSGEDMVDCHPYSFHSWTAQCKWRWWCLQGLDTSQADIATASVLPA